MKILYTTDQTYKHGGIEKVLSQKANYLAEVEGDEVIIVTHNQNKNLPVYPLSEKIRLIDLGINYREGISYFHPKNLKKIVRHKKELRKVLKQIQPDVVVSSSFAPDFYFLPDLEKQIPKVKEFHSSRYTYQNRTRSILKKIQKRKTKKAEMKYDAIVVLNFDELDFYSNRTIKVIPNPTEINNERANFSAKKVMAAGRISPVKNFADLIEIWNQIRENFPDWELHIYGEDYLDTQLNLQQKINQLDLGRSIRFMGISPEMKTTMKDYSIYAMTSETECFPMVLLEALSVGLPIISYDSPTGPKHIITPESDGLLVSYKNKSEFSEKITQLMANENLRKEFSLNAKENARRFQISTVMKQWKDLFLSLKNK